MAIASLSTLSTSKFKGGRGLSGSGDHSLVGELNTVIAKVNEVIAADGTSDTLEVGTSGAGAYYSGTNDSWLLVDGVNPPTISRLRALDETTGLYVTWRCVGGVWAVV